MKKYIPLTLLVFALCSCSLVFESSSDSIDSSAGISNSEVSSTSEDDIVTSETKVDPSIDVSSENSSSSISSSSSSSSGDNKENLKTFSEPNYEVRRLSNISEVTIDDLFNLGNKVSIAIDISNEELNKLQSDFLRGGKCDIYRLADQVTISLTNYDQTFDWTFKNVGIRQKGNTSRNDIIYGDDINTQNHFKLSFDETFDDPQAYDQDFISQTKSKMNGEDYSIREFLGLSGLDFKWNKNFDSTHIKEVYSSYIYQAGGIISQHIGISEIKMTKTGSDRQYSFGLCTIYEPAKKSLIKRSLQSEIDYVNMESWNEEKVGAFGIANEKYGDLYKCSYGIGEGGLSNGADMSESSISGNKVGVGNLSGSYVPAYERKTTKKLNYNDDQLRNFISVINSKSYSEIEKVVDIEYLAKEEAITYFLGNPDALRYNYNNYMLYFRRTDGKAIIIPIDNDRCFGITKDLNFKDGLTQSGMLSKDTIQGEQRNSLLNKTFLSNTDNDCKTLYIDICKSLADSPWTKSETFYRYYDIAKNTYSGQNFEKSNENMSFEQYMNAKLKTINDIGGGEDIILPDTNVYDNLYIVGNFNSWGNYSSQDLEKYHFAYLGNYTYQINITIENSLDNNQLALKINNGFGNYNEIDWSFSDDLTKLIKSVTRSVKIDNVFQGDSFEITINTNTCEAKIERKTGSWA